MIEIKTKQEIEKIRQAGSLLANIVKQLKSHIAPGITTKEIDRMAEELITSSGAIPAFKGYRGFPANICVSLNDEIVHGIPDDKRILKLGDIVSLDIGINLNGYFADTAITIAIGSLNGKTKRLIDVTKKALYLGISQAKPGNYLFDISYAIQSYVESQGFSVVRDFVGHGIGKRMHEDPEVPNFGKKHAGPLLQEGMVLAIEPMVNMGSWETVVLPNGWTAVSKDRSPSAHFEHTVAIMHNGPEILTQ